MTCCCLHQSLRCILTQQLIVKMILLVFIPNDALKLSSLHILIQFWQFRFDITFSYIFLYSPRSINIRASKITSVLESWPNICLPFLPHGSMVMDVLDLLWLRTQDLPTNAIIEKMGFYSKASLQIICRKSFPSNFKWCFKEYREPYLISVISCVQIMSWLFQKCSEVIISNMATNSMTLFLYITFSRFYRQPAPPGNPTLDNFSILAQNYILSKFLNDVLINNK